MSKMTAEEFRAKREAEVKKRKRVVFEKIKKDHKIKKTIEKELEVAIEKETDVEVMTQMREELENVTGTSILPTVQEIEKALMESSGLISFTAKKLSVPIDTLKNVIKKSKFLRELLMDIRESVIDEAEDSLLQRIRTKQDLIASMFLLKSLGKHRGWIDRPEKAGASAEKPIFIRILPVGMGDANPKGGRPAKINDVKQVVKENRKALKEATEEILDAEILN